MIAANIEIGIARLRDLVDEADVVVPFTGAGISTECGIPDFRSPGGLWTKYQPIPFDQFMASAEMRSESWLRRFAMDEQFSTARPGCGHLALASLHRLGKIPAVITQNSTICTKPRGLRPTRLWSCMAILPTPHALTAVGVMSLPGSSSISTPGALCRTATFAAATSKQRRSRLAKRCRRRPCVAPKRFAAPATCFWRSARLWWCGLQRDCHCWLSAAGHALSFSTATRPISTIWPISSSARTSGGRSNPSSPADMDREFHRVWEHIKRSDSVVLQFARFQSRRPEMFDCVHKGNKKHSFLGRGEWYVDSEVEAPKRGAKNGGGVRSYDDECN